MAKEIDLGMTLADFLNSVKREGTAGGFELPENVLKRTPPVLVLCVLGEDVERVKAVLKSQLGMQIGGGSNGGGLVIDLNKILGG